MTATLSQLSPEFKLKDLAEDLERMLDAKLSLSKARSRWTRVRHLVMSLKPMELIALHDGSQGHAELMEKLEMEVNFLLKRESRVTRDLAGVLTNLRDNGLGETELDMELAVQGLGDSLHDWDSGGKLPATALTELESTP